MIVRIMGEGQFRLGDEAVDRLNDLDEALDADIQGGVADSFGGHLEQMLAFVRAEGKPLADDEILPSDCVLPPSDITLDELRELLGEEGLIPG